jgi:hypothetical protein
MTKTDDFLPIIDHLRHAGSAAARAEIVLRMPLAVIVAMNDQLHEILSEYGDEPTMHYVNSEVAALLSVRDVTGTIQPEKSSVSARVSLVQTYMEAPCQTL